MVSARVYTTPFSRNHCLKSPLIRGLIAGVTTIATMIFIVSPSKNGRSPLHYVFDDEHLPIIEYLISKGADPNSTDNDKKTPLHYASEAGFYQTYEYLVSKGADPDLKDKNGKTPFYYAFVQDHLPSYIRMHSKMFGIG